MKEKILFFIDGWFLNFGIGKYLQEQYDFDAYAIINMEENAKKFFQDQKIVNYKKTWFMDHVSTSMSTPDLEYLNSFEKRYNVNLWQLIYFDRDFLHYNEIYRFTEKEILSIIEKECKFFETVLDEINPDYLSIFLTTNHYQELLRHMCQSRGIEILMLGPARFGNRSLISKKGIMPDDEFYSVNAENKSQTFEELREYIKKYDATKEGKKYTKKAFEENKFERYAALIKFFFTPHPKNYKKLYYNFGRTRSRVFSQKIFNYFRKKYRYYFINKNFKKTVNLSSPYIYFPLQMEPERVILMNSPYYTNQLSIISNIAKSIPVGYNLIVKEHPVMKVVSWRPLSFYKSILNLPNVKLLHPSFSKEEIIKNSSLVISIAGTTGLEALFYNKPVITFTKQIYSSIPGVYVLNNFEELPDVISLQLQKSINPNDLQNFIQYIEKNTFDYDYMDMTIDFAYRFGFKGPIMDAKLPVDEVHSFLKKYEKEFCLLAQKHLDKIKEIKKK